ALRSTMTPLRPAVTTTRVEASSRAAISLKLDSGTLSVRRREAARSLSATAFRSSFSASRISFCAIAFTSNKSRASWRAAAARSAPEGGHRRRPPPAPRPPAEAGAGDAWLAAQRAADGGLELVDRPPVLAERPQLLERGFPVRPLGVEEVEQAHAPSCVGELHGVPDPGRLRQVGISEDYQLLPGGLEHRQRRVHLRQDLDTRLLAQGIHALHLRLCSR